MNFNNAVICPFILFFFPITHSGVMDTNVYTFWVLISFLLIPQTELLGQ